MREGNWLLLYRSVLPLSFNSEQSRLLPPTLLSYIQSFLIFDSKFLKSVNFAGWWVTRRAAANAELAKLYVEACVAADFKVVTLPACFWAL